MSGFHQEDFIDFVLKHGVVGFHEEPLRLKSGRQSHFYVNWRQITNDAFLLDQLTDYIVAFLQDWALPCQTLYGVPEGATKTAIIAGLKWARLSPHFAPQSHRLAMGRAKPKEHGSPEDRFFIGIPAGPTIILEDTTTTGGSLLETYARLHAIGVNVVGAMTLTDREELRDDGLSVAAAFARVGTGSVPFRALVGARALLPEAVRRQNPSAKVIAALKEETNADF